MTDAAIALNRFGLGARPDDHVSGDAKRFLLAQFDRFQARPPALASAPSSGTVAAELAQYYADRKLARQQQGRAEPLPVAVPPMVAEQSAGTMGAAAQSRPQPLKDDPLAQTRRFSRRQNRDFYAGAVGLRVNAALTAEAPLVERLVHFWANHFAVSADKQNVIGLTGPFEFEAIRPHVLGKFRDLVQAVERHPAMLLYLDQAQSIGPSSVLGSRAGRSGAQRKVGLNENLAREIMELHTLGVRTGYNQADVTEFARAMTGWTVEGFGRGFRTRPAGAADKPGDFVFAARLHEPGERTIMGKRYADDGERPAARIIDDLSIHPATAKHIATKLVRHFVADDPPQHAVERCTRAFLTSDGDLPTVYRALIDSPEAWLPTPAKFKTPWEWSVSAMRALGMEQIGAAQAFSLLQQLGQPTWKPGQPAGWDDVAASWAGPNALMRRVEAAERFASRAGTQIDARQRAETLFPGALSPATQQAIARAESPGQGLALLLVAPEFMRR